LRVDAEGNEQRGSAVLIARTDPNINFFATCYHGCGRFSIRDFLAKHSDTRWQDA
jgi:hypothetical protein